MAATAVPKRKSARAHRRGDPLLATVNDCIERLGNTWLSEPRNRAFIARVQDDRRQTAILGHTFAKCTLRWLSHAIAAHRRFDRDREVDAILRSFGSGANGCCEIARDLIEGKVVAATCSAQLTDTIADLQPRSLGMLYETLLGWSAEIHGPLCTPAFRLTAPSRSSRRRTTGSFYTPAPLVEHVLDQALQPPPEADARSTASAASHAPPLTQRVCDPACGSGHFLLAAARRIAANMSDPAALHDVMASCIYGVDVDPFAVELCRVILWIEGGGDRPLAAALNNHIRCGHALLGAPSSSILAEGRDPVAADAWCEHVLASPFDVTQSEPTMLFHWPIQFPEVFARDNPGFDVVVGNPPFLSQLASGTALLRTHARLLRARSGGVIRGYSDVAFAFLMLGTEITRRGGRLALVQPQSLLASRDAQGVRRALAERATLRSLWTSQEHVFNAGVFTCAPTLEMAGPRATALRRFATGAFSRLQDVLVDMNALATAPTWSDLAAEAAGVPEFEIRAAGCISDLAQATADFRDQYYGLDGFIVESADLTSTQQDDLEAFPPLVTTGLIDLAHCAWGERGTRLLKKRWEAPRLDRRRMQREGALAAWADARLVPKILLATQTRVIEAFVDATGRFLPCVPVITVTPRDAGDIWRIAAALASPVTAALALRRFGGVALSAGAIKLAARQVLTMPLPCVAAHWQSAALHLRQASEAVDHEHREKSLFRMAEAGIRAFDLSDADRDRLGNWWRSRLTRSAMPATRQGMHVSRLG